MTPRQLALIQKDIAGFVPFLPVERLAGKRLLITGAGGYLASYLADTVAWLNDHALATPCHLLLLLRQPLTPDSRLGHLQGRPDVTMWQQDVREPLPDDQRIDFIVHAASPASPQKYLRDPLGTLDSNITATRHLLEYARTHGIDSFLYFSSSEIYGHIPAGMSLIPETYPGMVDTLSPRACYTEGKRTGETLCMIYHRQFGLPVKIVRPFHVYGCGQLLDDGRVVVDFLRQRLAHTPITALSDGTGIRSFTYIADAVMGYWQVLLSNENGEAFNIGEDQEIITIRALAEMIATLEEPLLPCHFQSAAAAHLQGTPSQSVPDMSKARQILGYQPRYRLREGLLRTLMWYRSQDARA